MKQRKSLYTICFALTLLAFSAYALLDTFVIRRVYAAVDAPASSVTTAAPEPCALSGGPAAAEAGPMVTDTSYEDESMRVTIDTLRVCDTTVYVARVALSDPSALQTAFSQASYGRNVTAKTSETAAAVGAILAVNGDNYGSRERGYVIRGGVLYRDTAAKDQEDLVIWSDGSFSIVKESEVTARELLEQGAQEVFSFGPGLISEGEITVSAGEEVDRAKASNPRTAVGITAEGEYLLVVSDGRTGESEGLTLLELAELLRSLGAETAYNLDGGGSSAMVFLGQVVNNSSSGHGTGRERAVTDILYIGQKEAGE